jgi:phospho-N-acetylmuramoyl-pentapeptide-transferase
VLYELLAWLERTYAPPGFGVFGYISVRAGLAALSALAIALLLGNPLIEALRRRQIGERIRDLGPASHQHKAGTPTMGGLLILVAILIPLLLWGDWSSIYTWTMALVTVWMGLVGFLDDYIKVVKGNKAGLRKRTKLIGQLSLGVLVGMILYIHPAFEGFRTVTTVPFVKQGELDYNFLRHWIQGVDLGWLIYIPVVTFIITAVSNAVNLTDGLDGLAAGTTAIVGIALAILAYVSGRVDFSRYLDILYLPGAGELSIYVGAMVGACLGFLWYNAYPAQVFMGDTGSLTLGAAIGTIAILVRKELLLPILCGIFFLETLSVIIQTTYFKYTRRRYGHGRRIFRMAPLHHHFELKGWHEAKVVVRFWIITVVLAIFTIITLKLR